MKQIALILVAVLFLTMLPASAEPDLKSMTSQELRDLRASINEELTSRAPYITEVEGVPLSSIFPDKVLAKKVRDELGLFSIDDNVDQATLDNLTYLGLGGPNVSGYTEAIDSLVGIGTLRNLKTIDFRYGHTFKEIPEEIVWITSLTTINFSGNSVASFPDFLCDMTTLKEINLSDNPIVSMPDHIGNLENLEKLDISNTNVTELPESIGDLSALRELDISKTLITSLPESMRSLTLEKFRRDGLDLD